VKYVLLIYTDHAANAARSKEESQAILDKYMEYTNEVVKNGVARGGEELRDADTARTVRVRNGETLTTDGPYAETKEQLGGFYILDCASMEEALEYAAKIPSAVHGSVEVRPVYE
jgi:hypothetical protein